MSANVRLNSGSLSSSAPEQLESGQEAIEVITQPDTGDAGFQRQPEFPYWMPSLEIRFAINFRRHTCVVLVKQVRHGLKQSNGFFVGSAFAPAVPSAWLAAISHPQAVPFEVWRQGGVSIANRGMNRPGGNSSARWTLRFTTAKPPREVALATFRTAFRQGFIRCPSGNTRRRVARYCCFIRNRREMNHGSASFAFQRVWRISRSNTDGSVTNWTTALTTITLPGLPESGTVYQRTSGRRHHGGEIPRPAAGTPLYRRR